MVSKMYPVILFPYMNRYLFVIIVYIYITGFAQHIDIKKTFIEGDYKLPNNIASLDYEDNGGSWLLAYWTGRYHGFIKGY